MNIHDDDSNMDCDASGNEDFSVDVKDIDYKEMFRNFLMNMKSKFLQKGANKGEGIKFSMTEEGWEGSRTYIFEIGARGVLNVNTSVYSMVFTPRFFLYAITLPL